jgi:signal transduction histidine kinase
MVVTAAAGERRLRPGLALDAVIAAGVFAVTVGFVLGGWDDSPDRRDADALGVVLAGLASLPLVARRIAPLPVFVTTALSSALLYGLHYGDGPPLGPTIAVFTLGLHPPQGTRARTLALPAIVALFAVHITATGIARDEVPVVLILVGTLLWGGAWAIGDRIRIRRERAAEREDEAARELRLAVAEERTRIARDLHDSAGHAINVILVQAGAARLLSDRDPERAQAALSTIEDVARETVGEIDRLVRGLREDGAAENGTDPPTGLASFELLVERHRAAGLDVRVTTRGEPRPLAPAVDQAAYRILQESLTNAGRHGGGAALVEIDYAPRSLRLTVSNPMRGTAPAGASGHGVVGMRERVTLLGGTLHAARDGLTYRVRAELPTGEAGG